MLGHNLMLLILLIAMGYHLDGTIFSSLCLFFIQALEDCICSDLIQKLLGRDIPGKVELDLLSLPVRLGGLGLFTSTVTAAQQLTCSMHTCSPLVDLIVSQAHNAASCFAN